MIYIYKILSKLLQLLLNLVFVIQICLLILVFLTAAYWFCDLVGSSAFSFATPLVDTVTQIMSIFYSKDIETSGGYIDGTLLLFDTMALLAVFLLAKSKYYIHKLIENCGYKVLDCKRKIEADFNKNLKEETDAMIKHYKKVAMVVELEAKNMSINSVWGGDATEGVKEKRDEAYKIFCSALKSLEGCRFIETNGKLVILLDDFDKVDNLIYFVQQASARINENMKKNKWQVFFYMAVDVYYTTTDFTKEVYPSLEKLLNLRYKNEILCYGNFNIRYGIKPEQMYYTILLKGAYDIDGGSDVYSVVKKD